MTNPRLTVKVEWQHLSPSDDQREMKERFERLTQGLTSDFDLRKHFHFVREATTSLSDGRTAALLVWKGALAPGSKEVDHGGSRMLLQFVRLDSWSAVAIPLEILRHDDYERRAHCIPSGFPVELTDTTAVDDTEEITLAHRSWIRLPLLPPMSSEIDTVEHPLALSPRMVLEKPEHFRTAVATVRDDDQVVPPRGGAATSLMVRYPMSALRDEAVVALLEENRNRPTTHPAVMLSDAERGFLESFAKAHHLPAVLDGSAGSGKTTILNTVVLHLAAQHHHDPDSLAPLFVTLNHRLLEVFRSRLKNGLVVFHGIAESAADALSRKVCRTIDELVAEATDTRMPRRGGAAAARDFEVFKRWWREARDVSPAGLADLEDYYMSLRQHVLGRVKLVDDDHFVFGPKVEDIKALLDTPEVPTDKAARLQRTLEDFGRWLTEHDEHLFSELVHRALISRSTTATPAPYGLIVIDEVQDLSPSELDFVLLHSRLALTAPLLHRTTSGYLPLIVAGDELQSVVPSGFKFSSFRKQIVEIAALRGMALDPDKIHGSVLRENFRAGTLLVEFGDAARRLLRDSVAPSIPLRTGAGTLERLLLRTPTDRDAHAESTVARIPFPVIVAHLDSANPSAGEAALGSDGQALIRLGGDPIGIDLAKGNEYPVVVIHGFGEQLLQADRRGSRTEVARWLRNALSVATTRARDVLYISDSDEGFEHLCRLFDEVDFDLHQIKEAQSVAIDAHQAGELLSKWVEDAINRRDLNRLLELHRLRREADSLIDERLDTQLTAWIAAMNGSGTIDWPSVQRQDSSLRDELVAYLWDEGAYTALLELDLEDCSQPGRNNRETLAHALIARLRVGDPDADSLFAVAYQLSDLLDLGRRTGCEPLEVELRRWASIGVGAEDGGRQRDLIAAWGHVADEADRAGERSVKELAAVCKSSFTDAVHLIDSIGNERRRAELRAVLFGRLLWWVDPEALCRGFEAQGPENRTLLTSVSELLDLSFVLDATSDRFTELVDAGELEREASAALLQRKTKSAVELLSASTDRLASFSLKREQSSMEDHD